MTALKQQNFITISDYLAGEVVSDVKHEYLGGTVHAMAGASNRHNSIATNALASLHGSLRGKSCQPFNSDTKVRIEFPDHTRFYYPDAMVVCDSRSGTDNFQDRPVVIVEVLSDSTRRKPDGGFAIEHHSGLESVISLPEIEATLALADRFERVDLTA